MTIFDSWDNTGPGNTPSAMVATAQTATAIPVRPSLRTTTASPSGSVKNMRRTRRK